MSWLSSATSASLVVVLPVESTPSHTRRRPLRMWAFAAALFGAVRPRQLVAPRESLALGGGFKKGLPGSRSSSALVKPTSVCAAAAGRWFHQRRRRSRSRQALSKPPPSARLSARRNQLRLEEPHGSRCATRKPTCAMGAFAYGSASIQAAPLHQAGARRRRRPAHRQLLRQQRRRLRSRWRAARLVRPRDWIRCRRHHVSTSPASAPLATA